MIISIILDTSSGDPLLDWLKSNASAVGLLSFIVVALLRGWLVPGKMFDRVLAERDRAIDIVYEQAQVARRALEAGEKK